LSGEGAAAPARAPQVHPTSLQPAALACPWPVSRCRIARSSLDRIVDGKLVEHCGLANEVNFMSQLGIELAPVTA
jgi:hypothetical protein